MNTSGAYWFWGINGKALLSVTCSCCTGPKDNLGPKSTESCSGMCRYLAWETRRERWNLQLLLRLANLQIPVSEKAQASMFWPQRHTPIISACVLCQPHYASARLFGQDLLQPGSHPRDSLPLPSPSTGLSFLACLNQTRLAVDPVPTWHCAHMCTHPSTTTLTTSVHSTLPTVCLCLHVRTES